MTPQARLAVGAVSGHTIGRKVVGSCQTATAVDCRQTASLGTRVSKDADDVEGTDSPYEQQQKARIVLWNANGLLLLLSCFILKKKIIQRIHDSVFCPMVRTIGATGKQHACFTKSTVSRAALVKCSTGVLSCSSGTPYVLALDEVLFTAAVFVYHLTYSKISGLMTFAFLFSKV